MTFSPQTTTRTRRTWMLPVVALVASAMGGIVARGATVAPLAVDANAWWLNTNFAEHGKPVDSIFYFIFWLTTVVLIAVQAVLVYFMIKYRARKDRPGKGIYSHGNTRLEMIWTLIPAVVLIVVALWTKRAWDDYRYNPASLDPNTLKVLVVGEQFKWNVIYPGHRGKIGRYLMYPKTTDLKWPTVPPGKSFTFPAVAGPAFLPEEQARVAIDNYIQSVNPLGRDFSDPDTDPLSPAERTRMTELSAKSDASADEQKELEALKKLDQLNDYSNANSRALVIPKGKPVEIQVTSRDVIHDFFLPNFRTKLDTVPGTKGKLYVTATKSCKEIGGGTKEYALADLETLVVKDKREVTAVVNEKSPGAELYQKKRPRKVEYWRYADKAGETIIRDGGTITPETIKALRDAGVQRLTANVAFYWDIVCEELCGVGHYTMQGKMIVADQADFSDGDYKDFYPDGINPKPVASGGTGDSPVSSGGAGTGPARTSLKVAVAH